MGCCSKMILGEFFIEKMWVECLSEKMLLGWAVGNMLVEYSV